MAARESGGAAQSLANDVATATAKPAVHITTAVQTPQQLGSHRLTYDGGSIPGLKTGAGVKVFLTARELQIMHGDSAVIRIPAASITEISYGQDVHRRVGAAIGLAAVSFGVGALMALTKSKKHFVGITWDDDGNKGGAAFQADKADYRGVLAGLEGVTGKKAVNSETMTVRN